MDLTKTDYGKDPCRAASIPYWKAVRVTVPEDMKILHEADFCKELLERYVDTPYFRLKHDLLLWEPPVLPKGYSLRPATAEEFADHIHACYGNGMTAAQVEGFTCREVYCPALWLAICEKKTGKIVATGIAELDREMGEGVLEWIQVSQGHRGRGLGTYVVRELLWRMKDMAKFATVSGRCDHPEKPEKLYRKCGFTGIDIWHILKRRGEENHDSQSGK